MTRLGAERWHVANVLLSAGGAFFASLSGDVRFVTLWAAACIFDVATIVNDIQIKERR